jgi:hypothetical protein
MRMRQKTSEVSGRSRRTTVPFTCPRCHTPGGLRITHRLELPPDARSDEITLQVVRCSHCRFEGLAVYEESRRGALDHESFSHTGYEAKDRAQLSALKAAIAHCPAHGDPRCTCAAHQAYGQHGAYGQWTGLDLFDLGPPFPTVRT